MRSMSRLWPGQRDVSGDLQFFRLWLRRPLRLGAVAPSGAALGNAMATRIDARAPGVVVELGGGTGSITKAIRKAGVAADDLIVVESEAALCEVIGSRFPGVRVWPADACDLEALVDRAGAPPVKTIVSSLPFLSMDDGDCLRILAAAFAVLAPQGELVQFTYGVTPPVPKRTLAALGIVGVRSEWVFWNLPPATVWRYRRGEVVGLDEANPGKNSDIAGNFLSRPVKEYVVTWLRGLTLRALKWGVSKLSSKQGSADTVGN